MNSERLLHVDEAVDIRSKTEVVVDSSASPSGRVMREPISFSVDGSRVVGMLDSPPLGVCRQTTGVVMLNSDDGCRLGPHRLWIRLAERLCREGYPCLRFDYRGCGDSEGPEGSPPGHIGLMDALAAEHILRERTGTHHSVLVGICYGAEIGLLAARCCPTVCGVVACSVGRYVTTAGYKRALQHGSHYLWAYARKLLQRQTWSKLVRGQVNGRFILGGLADRLNFRHHQKQQDGACMAEVLAGDHHRNVPALFIYGSADPLARQEKPGYQHEAAEQNLNRIFMNVDGADHNFSSLVWSEQVICAALAFIHDVACRLSLIHI